MEGNISNISILACKDFLFNNNALVARHNTTFKVIKTFTSGNGYNFTIDGYIFLFFFLSNYLLVDPTENNYSFLVDLFFDTKFIKSLSIHFQCHFHSNVEKKVYIYTVCVVRVKG